MEYLVMVVWIFLIGVEVYFNYERIEEDNVELKHWLWFIPRLVLGVWFMIWLTAFDYTWWAGAQFVVGTHALLYAEGLNISRGKSIGYMGDPNLKNPNKSLFDKIILWFGRKMQGGAIQMIWLGFRFIFFLWVVGHILAQGKCTWEQLNTGGC